MADRWLSMATVRSWLRRLRRFERRELRDLRRWIERTRTLVHLSILVFVPLLIGVVTLVSNAVEGLTYLLFPPLASGAYTIFAEPESQYASPVRFVTGMSVGAICGIAAVEAVAAIGLQQPAGVFHAHALAAALAVFLTGAITWPFGVEEASAYSTSLLAILVPGDVRPAFVASVFLSTTALATVFYVWRERFYEQRAEILYESTRGDDHVLVPMRGANPDETAMLAARLAGAHDAGKVVLLELVDDEAVARAERDLLDETRRADGAGESSGEGTEDRPPDAAVDDDGAVAAAASHLESRASEIETQVGVPCQVVVAVTSGSPARTVLRTARQVNCDLVATAYEERYGGLSPFLRDLFGGGLDVVVHRSHAGRTRWRRALVSVRGASDVAHGMIDFGCRLTRGSGRLAVSTCIGSERERRRAESLLADLVEPFEGRIETRVSVSSVEDFLAETAPQYDLVLLGASRDRSPASRFVSPPTFERLRDVETDVAIVHRH